MKRYRNTLSISTSLLVRFFALTLIAIIATGCFKFSSTTDIQPYNAQEHESFILDQFSKDYYWLVEGDLDVKKMLQTKSFPGYLHDYTNIAIDIAVHHKKPAGFVIYLMKAPGLGHIEFLQVSAQDRRSGVAKKLLTHAFNQLKKQGAHRATILVRNNNIKAQQLYTRMGFITFLNDGQFLHLEKTLN